MKVFIEEQRFTQWWLYIIMIIPLFVVIFPFIFNHEEMNNNKEAILGISISLLIMIAIIGLVLFIRLKTKIDEQGIYYQFFPLNFNQKFISWNDISKCYVRKYKPILEYGGWGIKSRIFFRNSNGVAYNIKGNIGLQLKLKNGKKILIGTQKMNEVERVLLTYKHKIIDNEN
jgi:hypothetical protein